jgi:hypothetical protein
MREGSLCARRGRGQAGAMCGLSGGNDSAIADKAGRRDSRRTIKSQAGARQSSGGRAIFIPGRSSAKTTGCRTSGKQFHGAATTPATSCAVVFEAPGFDCRSPVPRGTNARGPGAHEPITPG